MSTCPVSLALTCYTSWSKKDMPFSTDPWFSTNLPGNVVPPLQKATVFFRVSGPHVFIIHKPWASCTNTLMHCNPNQCLTPFKHWIILFITFHRWKLSHNLHSIVLQSSLTLILGEDICSIIQLQNTLQHSMLLVLFLPTSCSANLEIASFTPEPSPKFSSSLLD